jgi:hypothetical protein
MTVLPDGDVRGFYEALNIDLPGWADRYASTRCFAAPDEHTNGDRTPSLSVNLATGRFRCYGCGAWGGPYDAALAAGHTPRSAMELLSAYGLAASRPGDRPAGMRRTAAAGKRPTAPKPAPAKPQLTVGEEEVGEEDVGPWMSNLAERPALIARICRARGWRYAAMRELEVGIEVRVVDGTTRLGRLTIPIRDARGELHGVLRYRLPWRTFGAKMISASGTRLGLVPHPARERSSLVLLVEGPADALAARSHGLPAIAVPGADAWRAEWAELLAGRQVTVLMDADEVGRKAARRIHEDLRGGADAVVLDIAPERSDGYDLTDLLRDRRRSVRPAPEPAGVTAGLAAFRAPGVR